MGRPGIEPAIQGVGLFGEMPAAAVRAGEAVRKQFCSFTLKPGVAALCLKNLCNGLDALLRAYRFFTIFTVEHRNRQAPTALTGNAPVAALANHGAHAFLTPGREPTDIFTGGNCLILEGIHGAEPLRSRTENNRLLAAPAMRIAVRNVLRGEQHAALLHICGNDRIGILHIESGILACIIGVAALIIYRDNHLGPILQAGLIVDITKARCCVDTAGTGIGCHIVCQHQKRCFWQEGVIRQHILEERAWMRFNDLIFRNAALCHDRVHQLFGHNIHLAVGNLYNGIAEVRVQCDADVAGQGPGCCRPDHEKQFALIQMAQFALIIMHRELDINCGDRIFMILNLGFCQSSLVMGTPVNRLEALVNMAISVHLAEHANLIRFKARVHRKVRMLPVSDNAEALEASHLQHGILLCVVMACSAEVGCGHFLVVELLLFDDGAFNRHAVVVPARDIRDITAAHHITAVDKVFQRLIQRMTHVNIAVGKRRAVVE